ncbi:MAG: ThuA domain-containing protein [Rhodothermia bacterium]
MGATDSQGELELILRSRTEGGSVARNPQTWDVSSTAVIVCDMWDAHHCYNATRRGAELAPEIDRFVAKIRSMGGTVIHAPSSCMNFYKDHPARKRAIETPIAKKFPVGIEKWMYWIDENEEAAGYPIDHSDGGEDDDPAEHAKWAKELEEQEKNPRSPWSRQAEGIRIDAERDYITDDGKQNWSILESRGIDNVMLVGVHTNMCVLGRPFGLRQMAKSGKRVVLVRDLTDTMYNPAMPPKVSHFQGTDLIVEHIEKFVCPTISSEQVTGGEQHKYAADKRKHLVMMIGEKEYRTNETLPKFAREHVSASFRVTILTPDPKDGNRFPGIGVVETADVLLVSVRRRALPEAQLAVLRKYVAAGKPVVGIRTASHAFSLRGKPGPEGSAVWEKWNPEVFGGNYTGHHGNKLKTFAKAAQDAVLNGVKADEFATGGSLYEVRPLAKGATVLLLGRAASVEQTEPVAWTFQRADGGRSFYTSLGHVEDFETPEFVRLLSNAIYWAADLPAPKIAEKVGEPVSAEKGDSQEWRGFKRIFR